MSNPFANMTAAEMKRLMESDPEKFRQLEKETEVPVDPNATVRVFRNGRLVSGAPPAKE